MLILVINLWIQYIDSCGFSHPALQPPSGQVEGSGTGSVGDCFLHPTGRCRTIGGAGGSDGLAPLAVSPEWIHAAAHGPQRLDRGEHGWGADVGRGGSVVPAEQ